MGSPKLFNLELFYQMGIDPGTGKPLKLTAGSGEDLLVNAKRAIRIKDEQEAIHRYKWEGLPKGIDPLLLERIIYYRGQAMLFKITDEDYLFLPYAVTGSYDCYGRPPMLRPLVFGGSPTTNSKGEIKADDEKIFGDKYYKAVYDKDEEVKDPMDAAVILKDYTPQLADYIIPRVTIQEHAISLEAEGLPLARTKMIGDSGVKGMRVNDEGAATNVKLASKAIVKAAMQGDQFVPVVDEIEFQDLGTSGGQGTPEGSLMYVQALDNYRRSLLGIENGGIYQKKAHVLEEEESVNDADTRSVLADGLEWRKRFCELGNAVFGLSMSVSIDEEASKEPNEEKPEEKKEKEVIENADQ